ncbi:MAG: aminotransferase class I/II-fold pyridoxal phosphate-dependent enzyme, partial [Vicinamibacteria bacterium]|nr:aminotransferase class I/II-fold pyridoxal phosphate-dependent enzyme [Vicinamibacteria bacterium]
MRIEVFKSIEGIHEAWDRLAPRDRIVLESRHLLAIERSGVNAIDPYYLLVYDGRRLAGIVHGFIMKLDVASIDKSVPPDALATLRCWNRDFLNEPIFECGIVSGLGRTIAASDADLSQVCHAAANEMTRLALEAGAEFVLVRDVPYSMLQDHAAFLEEGYAPLLGFPIAKMAARWVSFDAYLDALKSHTRQDIRRAMSRRPAGVDVVYVSDFADHAERLAELWAQTSRRAADYSHEKLNPDYFREIQLCLPDRSRVIALKRRETIVAFVLSLIGDEEYFAVHCGVDQAGSERDNLYDFLMMTVIRDAFDQKRRLLNWGITTYDYKFKRGFEADPMIYFLKHVRQPCLTAALARGFQKGIRQPNNLHRPFKDQGLTRRPDWKALAAALPVTSSPQATDVLGKAYGYDRIDSMRLGSIYSFCPAFENAQGPIVRYRGRDVVMLGSNAYLGLGTHQKVIAAAKAAIDKYGTGCSGSPLLNGTLDLHVDLAGALADFMQKEEALLCSTGYQTNVGVVSAIVGKGDVVIMDRLNHASLVDGARLSGAEIMRYRHNDMDSLEHALKRCSGRGKLVVVDSVFSMEGTIADLPTIVELARKHGARTMVDEAHAIGVLGPKGRGAAEHFGVLDQVDIVMATFSKSLASIGGFVAADAKVIDYLRHVARSHIFSASLPPAAVAAVRAALEIVKTEPGRRRKLLENAAYMSARLQELGFDAPCHRTAVVPIHCDNDVLTLGAFKMLLERGV